jgi:hypothetical protein
VRNAISRSAPAFGSHFASVSMSARFTNASSSFRSRFSSSTLSVTGSLAAVEPVIAFSASSRKMVYVRPSTVIVARLPNESRDMRALSGSRPV